MKMSVSFVLGVVLSYSGLTQAKETISCRQINALTNVIKHDHAFVREQALREKLLTDQAFAASLRTGFIEELDPMRLFLLDAEVEGAHRDLDGDLATLVFRNADCGAFTKIFATYRAAIERSLRLVPARVGTDDPLKAEIVAAAERATDDGAKAKTWAKTEDEVIARTKALLITGTRAMAGVLAHDGAKNYADAYDAARRDVDRLRSKPYAEDEVPRLMAAVILAHLDPHSAFYGADEFNEFMGAMRDFVGLGVEISPGFGGVFIHAVLPNGPAARAGVLKDGDKIIKVDGQSVADLDIAEVSKLIRGPIDTHVKLEVLRAPTSAPIEIDVVRGRVSAQETTRREVIDTPTGPVGYLRFRAFGVDGAKAVAAIVQELEQKNIRGLILDLRGNPGGVLDEAVALIEQFERRAPARAVYYVGIEGPKPMAYAFRSDGPKFDRPLIVLIDAGSASASEIVSGALQAYGRALVIGDGPSFGKGSVQHVLPLTSYGDQHAAFKVNQALGRAPDGGLVLTSGFYFLPDGTSIQNVGVTPDVVLYPERAPGPAMSEKGLYEHSLARPDDLGNRLIPQADVDLLKPYRAKMAPAREALNKAFAEKKDELRKVNPQDPEKAAAVFLLEELIKQSPGT